MGDINFFFQPTKAWGFIILFVLPLLRPHYSRFEPGMGGLETATLTPRPPHVLKLNII